MPRKKGIPKLRLKARIASKVREKDLIEKAKLLAEDPELILPECTEDCGSCPFRKTRARLEKIVKYKDDPHKLAGFSKWGDKLARAYAATIALAHEEKTPYLATATYKGSTITYVLRGRTPKEKLIGVQNFDSPKWRVLSVLDLVQKKGLHFYSFGDDFVCTGRYSRPPDEYVKLAAESIGAGRLDGNTYSCPHSPASVDHMEFNWVSSGKKILICDTCNAKIKNTLSKLAEGMAVPEPISEFEISIRRPLKTSTGDERCRNLLDKPIEKELLDKYSSGEFGNKELVDTHMQEVLEALRSRKMRVFVRGDRCFGDDVEAFVTDMTQDEVEKRALIGLLTNIQNPVVVGTGDSVNKLLSTYWAANGEDALKAFVPEEVAKKYHGQYDEESKSPLKVIRLALRESEHAAICSKIPDYKGLSRDSAYVDKIVRAYKTSGANGAVSVLDNDKSSDHRTRSITHAFYLALGVTTKSWKFTDEEREYGKHLELFAKRLLETSEPDTHHEAFNEFLIQAGCSEELKRE